MALEKQLLLTNHVIVQYAMVWLTPNNMHLLYMYYLANCGHSRSNGVGISRGNNKKLGWWRGCHLTNTSHPHASYHAKFDRCCSHDLTTYVIERR